MALKRREKEVRRTKKGYSKGIAVKQDKGIL